MQMQNPHQKSESKGMAQGKSKSFKLNLNFLSWKGWLAIANLKPTFIFLGRVAQIVGLSRNMTSFRIIFSESVCSTFAIKSAVF